MENFKHYEAEVLVEEKIVEIQETSEFKLYAEGKLNENDFISFLTETYGETLAEGVMDYLRGKGRKLGATAALAGALMGAPGASAAPPEQAPTHQLDYSQDAMGNFKVKLVQAISSLISAKGTPAFKQKLDEFVNALKDAESNNLITNGQAKALYNAARSSIKGENPDINKSIETILSTTVREEVK